MDREEAIIQIEALYPPDSEYPETAEVGKGIMEKAKSDVHGWRCEPTEVLIRAAQLCMYEDRKPARATQ